MGRRGSFLEATFEQVAVMMSEGGKGVVCRYPILVRQSMGLGPTSYNPALALVNWYVERMASSTARALCPEALLSRSVSSTDGGLIVHVQADYVDQ